MLGGSVSATDPTHETDKARTLEIKNVYLLCTSSGRGRRCHSSSEMKGINGEISFKPVSKQVTSVDRAADFADSSEPRKIGLTDSCKSLKRIYRTETNTFV